jgi:hypothetical protein
MGTCLSRQGKGRHTEYQQAYNSLYHGQKGFFAGCLLHFFAAAELATETAFLCFYYYKIPLQEGWSGGQTPRFIICRNPLF